MKYTIEITEDQKEAIEKLLDKKMEEVDESRVEEEKEWPQHGDKYFFVDSFGNIVERCWVYGGLDSEARKKIGNIFKSKKEAEFAVERLKVINELKQFTEKDWPWNQENKHHFLLYDVYNERVRVENVWSCKRAELYFSSEKDALDAIKAVGEERIKKYYLEIGE